MAASSVSQSWPTTASTRFPKARTSASSSTLLSSTASWPRRLRAPPNDRAFRWQSVRKKSRSPPLRQAQGRHCRTERDKDGAPSGVREPGPRRPQPLKFFIVLPQLGKSTSPPCRKERDKDGAPSEFESWKGWASQP